MIIFVNEKRNEFCNRRYIIVVNEFHDIDSINSIILSIIAIQT